MGPARLHGDAVEGKPGSGLDLGVALLEHPLDYWEGQARRQRLEDELSPLFAPLRLHLLLLKQENAHVQYAAHNRRRVLALYGDRHSWRP